MSLSQSEIEAILLEVSGHPASGAVAEIIPAMAAAVAKAGKPAKAASANP